MFRHLIDVFLMTRDPNWTDRKVIKTDIVMDLVTLFSRIIQSHHFFVREETC